MFIVSVLLTIPFCLSLYATIDLLCISDFIKGPPSDAFFHNAMIITDM